jgi:hypothetical protein
MIIAWRRFQGIAERTLRRSWFICFALSLTALLVHGYHPFAEDAGIYIPAIKKTLDPSLYPQGSEIFMLPARFSLFTRALALSVQVAHVPLPYMLLLWFVTCLFLTISACWKIAEICLKGKNSGLVGASIVAAVISMPAAGCALLLSDPYLTSRSVATPLILFSVLFLLRRKHLSAFLMWATSALFHPLMAVIDGMFLVLIMLTRSSKWPIRFAQILLFSFIVTVVLSIGRHPVGEEYRAAVMSRSYFFLSQWTWYEIFGAVAPLLLFASMAWKHRRTSESAAFQLSLATTLFGGLAILGAAAVTWMPGLFIFGRFQPMRAYQLIYLLLLSLPANFGLRWIARNWSPRQCELAFALVIICLSYGMYVVQRRTFPASRHVEWPWSASENSWQQAYDWVRNNTPKDAVFALSPEYPNDPGNDRQGFRATAERSALPDRAKDGGVAALFPEIAPTWRRDTALTAGIDSMDESEQVQLQEGGATWIMVRNNPKLKLDCPYSNPIVEVCQLNPRTDYAQQKSPPITLSLHQVSVR